MNYCHNAKTGGPSAKEQQWHKVFMMIFKRKKVINLEKTVVGDLEYGLSDVGSDSEDDY